MTYPGFQGHLNNNNNKKNHNEREHSICHGNYSKYDVSIELGYYAPPFSFSLNISPCLAQTGFKQGFKPFYFNLFMCFCSFDQENSIKETRQIMSQTLFLYIMMLTVRICFVGD